MYYGKKKIVSWGTVGKDGATVYEHYYDLMGKTNWDYNSYIVLMFHSAQSTVIDTFDAFVSYLKAGGYTNSSKPKIVTGGAIFDSTLKGVQDEMHGIYYNPSDNTIRTVGLSGNFSNEVTISDITKLSVYGKAFVREVY